MAFFDPNNELWGQVSDSIADDLVKVPSVYLGQWLETLHPIRSKFFSPLSGIYRNTTRHATERSLATDILADYAADQPQVLASLLMDADEKQFSVIFPKFERYADELSILIDELDRNLGGNAPDEAKEKLAKRQANAAVALLRFNRSEKVWPLLKHSPDPRVRSYLIHRLGPFGVDPQVIIDRFDDESDVTIQRALLLSLGEFTEEKLPIENRTLLLPKFQAIYREATDPGLHASVEWLFRQWNEELWLEEVNQRWANDKEQQTRRLETINRTLATESNKAPQWFVNGQGQTMVVIPGPVEFLMGSPSTEIGHQQKEVQQKKRIGRIFALAAKQVTVQDYLRFSKKTFTEQYAPELDCPIISTSWYEAAAYCNWLSAEEGIPDDQWCYEINGNETKLSENYLSLTGYRLPTEAEMEFAMRAGSITSRCFGETDELLSKYAWYQKNSQDRTWPVGSLKPNDLGLFDTLGNANTWCQERALTAKRVTDEAINDVEDKLVVVATFNRVLKGGSRNQHPTLLRSAFRSSNVPSYKTSNAGFRLARTIMQPDRQ